MDLFDSYHVATDSMMSGPTPGHRERIPGGSGGTNATKAVPFLQLPGGRRRPNPTKMGLVIPPQYSFAGVYNSQSQVFRTWQDEAQRNSLTDALAMWRDPFMRGLLKRRMMPVINLPWSLEVDDPKDPEQKAIAEDLTRIVEATPDWGYFLLSVMYSLWYGRAAAQCDYGHEEINGERRVIITNHRPVQGDKFVTHWSGLPAVLIYGGFDPGANNKHNLFSSDRGLALLLADPYFRERFVYAEFEPTDKDWLFEPEMAAAIHGDGLRSQCYWSWWLRQELISYMTDGLQRISANGMIYAYYPSGNQAAQEAVIQALKELIRDNVAAFPREPGTEGNQGPLIERIEPSGIAYDILEKFISHIEGIITQMFLGQQSDTSQQQYAGAVESQEKQVSLIVRYDSNNLAQVLTKEFLKVVIRFNRWVYRGRTYFGQNLPFRIRFKFQLAPIDVKERIENAIRLLQANVPIDLEQVRDVAGFSAPRDDAQIPGQPPGRFGEQPANGQQPPGAPNGQTNGLPKMPGLPNETKGGATEEAKLSPMKPLPAVGGVDKSKMMTYGARLNVRDWDKLRRKFGRPATNGKH